MADIPRITTPMIEKAPVNLPPRPTDPAVPFNLSDVSRVMQTHDATEILQQNTGYLPGEEAPKILADLLKDPSVTVGMMRNIYLLQEVIKLLPATNQPLNNELEQLFARLMLSPEDLVAEMQRQEQSTTLFKGELFDMLRGLLMQSEASSRPELATGVGVLLKALNSAMSQTDTLHSVANNLQFIADSLGGRGQLAEKILQLIPQLRAPDAPENYVALKDEVLTILSEVENSVLYTPQMEKVLPLIVYNLSRFNDNEDFLPDALRFLLSVMDGDAPKAELTEKLEAYIGRFLAPDGAREARAAEDDSRVMDVLAKIIGRETSSDELKLMSGDKLEKIVHSLLSSPSNFTPLLHFILPVEFGDLRAFAEIWIDPNAEEEESSRRGGGSADTSHMLMVFDVDGVGRFETELFVQDRRIAMNLLCPPPYLEFFQGIGPAIRQALAGSEYRFEAINIDRLGRTHSLMDVFTDLPRKRMGIDVKV